jgi:hypothetical protein
MKLVEFRNGARTQPIQVNIDALRGCTLDQIVLVSVDRGYHYANRPMFTFMLRDGENVSFLTGRAEVKEFHALCVELRQSLPGNRKIDEL